MQSIPDAKLSLEIDAIFPPHGKPVSVGMALSSGNVGLDDAVVGALSQMQCRAPGRAAKVTQPIAFKWLR